MAKKSDKAGAKAKKEKVSLRYAIGTTGLKKNNPKNKKY